MRAPMASPMRGSCRRRRLMRWTASRKCNCPHLIRHGFAVPPSPHRGRQGTRLRRPYLFSRKRKDRGEKSAWGRVWCILPLNSGGYQCFGLAFHTGLTLRASWYAPPDTGVSNLQLVSVEYLPSIEGATELLMGATFLRGPCSGAIIRQRSTANSGWRSLCGDQSSISSNASSPFLASALTSPWRTKSMVTKLRATNSAA